MIQVEEDKRNAIVFFKQYSLVFFLAVFILFFNNLTSIPPVTGHLIQRSLHISKHHDKCIDADCACSESAFSDEFKINKPEQIVGLTQIDTIPKISTNNEQMEETTDLKLQAKNNVISSTQDLNSCIATDNTSFYSADVSEMSVLPDVIRDKRRHKKIQTLHIRQDTELQSPLSSLKNSNFIPTPRTRKRFRRKLRKNARKQFKDVTRIQIKQTITGNQISLILFYLANHLPHWSILVLAVCMPPSCLTILLLFFRIWTNCICCINAVVLGFCHPKLRLRKLRLIHPEHLIALSGPNYAKNQVSQ